MTAKPLFQTRRNKRRKTFGAEVVDTALLLGYTLMGWQSDLLMPAMEWRRDGRPFHKTIVVTCSRQQGKTVLMAAIAVWRALWKPDQHIVFLAQTRGAASARLFDVATALQRAGVPGVKWYRGVGNEHVQFSNGSRIDVESPNIHGGHGASYHLIILDEAFSLQDHTLQGLLPTQTALRDSQLVVVSTMGTEDSAVWNRYVDLGRASVKDRTSTIAYTEYAADLDAGDDVFNPEHWSRWMPALGQTVEVASIMPSMDSMSPGEFMRAFGNVVTSSDSDLFPPEWWPRSLNAFQARPDKGLVFGFDVSFDPAGASIAAAWPTEHGWHTELVERQAGGDSLWMAQRMKSLVIQHRPLGVVTAGGGPARSIAEQVKALCTTYAVPFRQLAVQDMAASHQLFYDLLRSETLTHGDSTSLAEAVARVRVRDAGDQWRFDRRATRVDCSPLFAAAAALFAGQEYQATKPKYAIY